MLTAKEFWYRTDHAQRIVSAQAACTRTEALFMMVERAHVQDQTLDEIVTAVLDHTIRFAD